MAFRFRTLTSPTVAKRQASIEGQDLADLARLPKLTNAQMNQLAKLYPSWLKDNTALKQLPAIYQGVLGQVQLQPGIGEIEKKLIAKQDKLSDYMNRFTDTERVHQLLSASQLPNDTLATIWAYVNKTFPGKLTNREVCLALALIAIFQKLEKEALGGGSHFIACSKDRDPFSVVKTIKKPPVPTLYPTWTKNNANSTSASGALIKGIVQSKSTPENLSSTKGLLVDIFSGSQEDESPKKKIPPIESCECQTSDDSVDYSNSDLDSKVKCVILSSPLRLMDTDYDKFEINFNRTTRIWSRFLTSIKRIFKCSFDILNVENSRQSAIEALKSPRGLDFGRDLCLCYPLAHNIKHKFDQLNSIKLATDEQTKLSPTCGLFNRKYVKQIDDLMTSINEYWAVLINLLHESGQTKFIEMIMDGLIDSKNLTTSSSIEDIAMEFSPRSGICSICRSGSYLNDVSTQTRQLPDEVMSLVEPEDLISGDEQHYYHPRCASFWLNQVDADCLPLPGDDTDPQPLLSPALLD